MIASGALPRGHSSRTASSASAAAAPARIQRRCFGEKRLSKLMFMPFSPIRQNALRISRKPASLSSRISKRTSSAPVFRI